MAAPVFADGWQPVLMSHNAGPEQLIAIDKSSQKLYKLERKSPIRAVMELPCTTGQAIGDKLVMNDLRTPEGVYFLGPKIDRKLDWTLYGNIAYSLNYPNPIDKLKGKTGYGIWLHGRGKQLVPRDTRGCIAMNVTDLKSLGDVLRAGTPVVVAESVSWQPESGAQGFVATELQDSLNSWAADWESRDVDAFLSHYDANAFDLSESGNFSIFSRTKRNVIGNADWIHVLTENFRALPGPDYWVTTFDQFYRSDRLTQTVGKRFYWMKNGEGRWVIVGREYTMPAEDLTPVYLGRMKGKVQRFVDEWVEIWRKADASAYMNYYTPNAVQGDRRGSAHIADYKKTLWEKKPPVKVGVGPLEVDLHPAGFQVSFEQEYADASGYSDKGIKTLILAPETGGNLKILSEQWRRQ